MHRIEGDYYDDSTGVNLFQDVEQNRTKVPAAWLNAVQEELCNLITSLGGSLHEEGTDSARTDLYDAFVSAGIALPAVETIIFNTDKTFIYPGYGAQKVIYCVLDTPGVFQLSPSGVFPDGYSIIIVNNDFTSQLQVHLDLLFVDHPISHWLFGGMAREAIYDAINDKWQPLYS